MKDYQLMGAPSSVSGTGMSFSELIQMIINVSLGLGVLLAIVLLVVGGVQYVTVDTFAGKSEGKERIQNALMGLVFLFISFLILKIINPTLISKGSLNIAKVQFDTTAQCGMDSENHATENAEKFVKSINQNERYDWKLEGSDYWRIKDKQCFATLGNMKDGKFIDPKSCGYQADNINQESIDNGRGDNKGANIYAICISCPKNKSGSETGGCGVFIGDKKDVNGIGRFKDRRLLQKTRLNINKFFLFFVVPILQHI